MNPFVQNPSNSQNYNRFSYVLNNPLKYTDPSGYNYSYYIDGLKISYNTFRNYLNWMSSEQKELFEKFEYTRDPNNRSDFNFTIQNDDKTNTYYSKHNNRNGFWVEWDGKEKISDNELLSLGFKSNYNYTYARYAQFFEFDLFNWGGGDDSENNFKGNNYNSFMKKMFSPDASFGVGITTTMIGEATNIPNPPNWCKMLGRRINKFGGAYGFVDNTISANEAFNKGHYIDAAFQTYQAYGYGAATIMLYVPITAPFAAPVLLWMTTLDIGEYYLKYYLNKEK